MAEKLKKARTRKAAKAEKRANDEGEVSEKRTKQTFAEWLSERGPEMAHRALTDVEIELLDRGYRDCLKPACSIAARITGCTRKEGEDIVHGAVARMIRAAVTGGGAFPKTVEELRRRVIGAVRFLARQVIAGPRSRPPIRGPGARCVPSIRKMMTWREAEQLVSRRKVPERGLLPDMEGYADSVNGPLVEEPEGVPWAAPRRTTARYGPGWPKSDPVLRAWDLSCIFDVACCWLPPMERKVIEPIRDGRTREEIARELEISPKTVDKLKERAYKTMHDGIVRVIWSARNGPDSPHYERHWSEWNPIIKRLEARRLERLAAAPDKAA